MKLNSLIDNICNNGAKYNLFHLFNLLEYKNIEYKTSTIRDLSFPASEIKSVEQGCNSLKVNIRYSGLNGVDSPLPLYLLDALNKDNNSANFLSELLDIVNHRYYQLLYKIWKKFNLSHNNQDYNDFLSAISGLNINSLQDCNVYMDAFSLSKYSKNTNSLRSILHKLLSMFTIKINDKKYDWQHISSNNSLGHNAILANNVILGDRFYSNIDIIEIKIITPDYQQLIKVYKDKQTINNIFKITENYFEKQVKIHLIIMCDLHKKDIKALGEKDSYLGFNSALLGPKFGTKTILKVGQISLNT